MLSIAYLINRYPETSLTTIRREITAVCALGKVVHRFAHRPSRQPLAGEADRIEATATRYLAERTPFELMFSLLRVALARPREFASAVRRVLSLRPLHCANLGHLFLACTLLESLLKARVEHLHVHFAMNSAVVAMLTRLLGGPRWTMTVHGPEEFEPSHLHNLGVLVRASSTTIAISRSAADVALGAAAEPNVTVRVVGMGVDGEYLAQPQSIDESGPILCIGRFDRRKGHHVLLDAISSIPMRKRTFLVHLIGDGPLRREFELQVVRRELGNNVKFCGWLSEHEIRRKLDACRFLVHPSLAEGLPVVIMEAFARARPVIATEVGGITELVAHGQNGLVVSAGSAIKLANAIEALHTMTPERLYEFGMRGREVVLRRFNSLTNAQALVAAWAAVYN